MGKLIDKLCVFIALFILTFIMTLIIAKNSIVSLIVGLLLSTILSISLDKLTQSNSRRISSKNFDTYMQIMGINYQLDIISKLYDNAVINDKCLIYDNIIIVPIFKFSNISRDDVIRIYQLSKKLDIHEIYIITNNLDRTTISFANMFVGTKFYFVKSKELYILLAANKLLPNIEIPKVKQKLPFRELIHLSFSKGNAKRYLFTSFILFIIGFLTPLRTYYFVLSGITSLLCLISILNPNDIVNHTKLPISNKKDLHSQGK